MGFLAGQYGVEVSPEFISSVTDAVMAEVGAWQARPLEPMHPVVFFDALRVNIREVKFWMKVFNDLKTRGVADILITVTDGLKGMPDTRGAVSPATSLQTCLVHLIRNSLDYASWKGSQAAGPSDQADLHRPECRGGAGRDGCLRAGSVGPQVPHRRARLAPGLGPRDPVLRVPAGGAPGDLPDQRDREHQRAATQDHQVARSLPQRRCGAQADLPGGERHQAGWDRAAHNWKEAMNQFAMPSEERFTRVAGPLG